MAEPICLLLKKTKQGYTLMLMNKKLLHLLVIIASLIGYLEWGNKQHLFIFQAEAQIFYSLLKHPSSVFHPLVVLPFLGQLLLATNMFKPNPKSIVSILGVCCIAILFLLLLLAGLLSKNYKIIMFTIPFFISAYLLLRSCKKK